MARKKKAEQTEQTELSEPITPFLVVEEPTAANHEATLNAVAYLLSCPNKYPRSASGQWWAGYNLFATRLKEVLENGS